MSRQHQPGGEHETNGGGGAAGGGVPGKRSRSELLPVQRKPQPGAGPTPVAAGPAPTAVEDSLAFLDADDAPRTTTRAPQAGGGSPVVQRKVTEGWKGENSWNTGRTTIDSTGQAAGASGGAVANAQGAPEKPGSDAVTRLVLGDLSHARSGQAVVVVPAAATLKAATALDVLLHFHGGGDDKGAPSSNHEQGNTAKIDGKRAPDSERTHDLHQAKVPQQLAAFGGAIVAITVERKGNDRDEAGDGLVAEVFDHLRAHGLLQPTHVRGRTIVSGHSAGVHAALDEAEEHEPARGTQPGRGTPQETVHGLFLFDPVSPAMPAVMALVVRRLENDLAQITGLATPADQLDYLKTDGYLVRIFGEEPRFNINAQALQKQIDAWFTAKGAKLPADAAVMSQWRSNYQAIGVKTARTGTWDGHRSMEGDANSGPLWDRSYRAGDGNLEQALSAWRAQHAPARSGSSTP